MAKRGKIIFYLNGKRMEAGGEEARMMLADYLREERALSGTKIVCAEGDCGACTVLRYFPKISAKAATPAYYLPVNSCITTVAQMDGSSLVTVDALAEEKLTPVQEAMVSCHGSQCGYCTPGFVMALTGVVEKKLHKKEKGRIEFKEAKNGLTGNLCRCTGYLPILDAASKIDTASCVSVKERFHSEAREKDLKKVLSESVDLREKNFSFFAPKSVSEAARYLAKHRDVKIVGAGTDLGVVHNKYKARLEKLLSLHLVPELYEIKQGRKGITVGARVTLSELRHALKEKIPAFARFLDLFASPQIKNVATLVGNVGNASPIADTPPFLLAMDALVEIAGPKSKRSVPMEKFYLAYRKTALKAGEIVTGITIPAPGKEESLKCFKSSQRKDLDISAVNAAFRLCWEDDSRKKLKEARLAMGGVAATPLRLFRTEECLRGTELSSENILKALAVLQEEIHPIDDLRGSAAFRRILAENFLKTFLVAEKGKAP